MKMLKKMWYWMMVAGLVILGIAVYSAMGKSGQLKQLLKQRPKRKPRSLKLPEAPTLVDYVDLYYKKINKLRK